MYLDLYHHPHFRVVLSVVQHAAGVNCTPEVHFKYKSEVPLMLGVIRMRRSPSTTALWVGLLKSLWQSYLHQSAGNLQDKF